MCFMFSTIISAAICGMNAMLVHVEVDMAKGLPGFLMVGYLSSEVKEAGERVRVALKNSGIMLSPMRTTVNLSPANIRKEGTAFDLPIAVGMLRSMDYIKEEAVSGIMIVGELSLNGKVNPIKGILPLVRRAKAEGIKRCLVPEENKAEGAVISGIEVIGAVSLQDALSYLRGERREEKRTEKVAGSKVRKREKAPDFSEISGQAAAKRAAEIAAAGFHNLLLVGPPGSGKTMIANRLTGILPPLTKDECLEVSSLYSVAGKLSSGKTLIEKRPFLSPHHTVTVSSLTGGGRIPRPGIISLAHLGVLFLDEMPEFGQHVLDMLRQPLEEKQIHIDRIGGNCTYPADFMLVGALNPCPCGYYPDVNRCRCTSADIKKYQSRISGPILDRVDLCAEVSQIAMKELTGKGEGESSAFIRKRVIRARKRQEERYSGRGYECNAGLTAKDIPRFCLLEDKEEKLMEKAFSSLRLSARGYYRILRVARTIADLDESEQIKEIHLAEAISYRMEGNKYWER